ncbi:hypothetical protein DL93DRAFT_2084430, partial [Clavulina sp. PMI_390]
MFIFKVTSYLIFQSMLSVLHWFRVLMFSINPTASALGPLSLGWDGVEQSGLL